MADPPQIPDATAGNWVDRYAPPAMRPFAQLARWDRPIGWWLLLLPCWWSATLGADSLGRTYPGIVTMVLFLVGAIAMRGAGCTYNDIVDRDLDAGIARTRSRPIASGQVTVGGAGLFMAVQALIGLAILLQFNRLTIFLGFGSLLVIAVYPFLKRFTNWPQIGLGLAFSWGALLGWTAETGSLGLAPMLLYAGAVFWVVGYDTIYAMQDLEDDALIGIGSTARLFGRHARQAIALLYATAIALFGVSFLTAGVGWIAYVGLALGAIQLARQAIRSGGADADLALRLFRSNRGFGLILLVGLIVDAAVTA